MTPPRPPLRHDSGDYPPAKPSRELGERVAKIEGAQQAERQLNEERFDRIDATTSRIEKLVLAQQGTCEEARDAAREASAQMGGIRRDVNDHGRRIGRLERSRVATDRHGVAAPVYRDFTPTPITVGPPQHPTPAPVDPPAPTTDGVQVKASLSSALILRILAVLGVGGGGALLAKLPEWIGGGG